MMLHHILRVVFATTKIVHAKFKITWITSWYMSSMSFLLLSCISSSPPRRPNNGFFHGRRCYKTDHSQLKWVPTTTKSVTLSQLLSRYVVALPFYLNWARWMMGRILHLKNIFMYNRFWSLVENTSRIKIFFLYSIANR